ncbi:hypothetical protein VPH35_139102 [Triticum aestivum]
MAAGHPLPTDLALLHQQLLLRPRVLGELRALTSTVVSIDHIASILDKALRSSTPRLVQVDPQAPEMHAKALSAVSRNRRKYDARRSFLRSRLEQLLDNYASQHFWEPRYRVNFICGVEALGGGTTAYGRHYAVNFMAASESPLQINTLFFAEFGESEPGHWLGNRGPYAAKPKPDFCCPLPPPYTGMSFLLRTHSARKLVYPNLVEYLKGDITVHGTDNVADMLETDLVYFSSEGDVEFAEKLNSYYQPNSSAWSRPSYLTTRRVLEDHFSPPSCHSNSRS